MSKKKKQEEKTLVEAMNDLTEALNETWHLILKEVKPVVKKINDVLENRGKRN